MMMGIIGADGVEGGDIVFSDIVPESARGEFFCQRHLRAPVHGHGDREPEGVAVEEGQAGVEYVRFPVECIGGMERSFTVVFP